MGRIAVVGHPDPVCPLAAGDPMAARDGAHRAVAVDERPEGAYGVLVGAALAQGHRSAAHRLLQHCLALEDLGVTPPRPPSNSCRCGWRWRAGVIAELGDAVEVVAAALAGSITTSRTGVRRRFDGP